MKLPVRILLWVLCAVMILLAPFVISSPQILEDARWEVMEQFDDESGWLFNTAYAEEWEDASPEYELPFDLSPGMKPNPAKFTETGYEDDSISVQIETITEDRVIWRIARINIASPTQLRTAIASKNSNPAKALKADKTAYLTKMAKDNNAVIAMNGSRYSTNKENHTYEVRMMIARQKDPKKNRDILVTDENGDFHIFVNSEGIKTFEKDTGHTIINALMFGPALVKDGQTLTMPSKYPYNLTGYEIRAAIGQIDKLSYVIVIADCINPSYIATRKGKEGVTMQELADYMKQLGCIQAYNFDGGNSAMMVMNGKVYNHKLQERDLTDMIYFATAVPEEAWN